MYILTKKEQVNILKMIDDDSIYEILYKRDNRDFIISQVYKSGPHAY